MLGVAFFELCANIAKHSGGREAALISFQKEGFYNLQIRDDGQGGLPVVASVTVAASQTATGCGSSRWPARGPSRPPGQGCGKWDGYKAG